MADMDTYAVPSSEAYAADAQASWRRLGFELYTTDQLRHLLDAGNRIELPDVDLAAFAAAGYDVDGFDGDGCANDIVSIEYVGEEPVQCIAIDDPDHLYITDGFIPTHNTANIVFLKSTDDQMLDTLEKMSGKTHQTHRDSKMVSRDISKPFLKNEPIISYTSSTVEEPVISYNDLAFLPERNSIMFMASAPCVWNRNETILPMSWRMYGANQIKQPNHEYTLQTIPTLSSAVDFDVRKNQPDFEAMLNHRIEVASHIEEAKELYQNAYGYTDYELSQLDEDVYSNEIMDIVDKLIYDEKEVAGAAEADAKRAMESIMTRQQTVANDEMVEAVKDEAKAKEERDRRRYARGSLSRGDLINLDGTANHSYDLEIISAFRKNKAQMHHDPNFIERGTDGGINAAANNLAYIKRPDRMADAQALADGITSPSSRVWSGEPLSSQAIAEEYADYEVTDSFLKYLASFEGDWPFAGGKFAEDVHYRLSMR